MSVIEVVNVCLHERLAKHRHYYLPVHVSDHCYSFHSCEVFGFKLEFLPDCRGFPTVEAGHVEQHAQFSMLLNKLIKFGHETHVVGLGQNPADTNGKKIPAVVFIYANRHF
jgi:hypothetical protein